MSDDAAVKKELAETADRLEDIKRKVSCQENKSKVGAAHELLRDVVKDYERAEASKALFRL